MKNFINQLNIMKIEYRLDQPLREYTTFGVGGNCDIVLFLQTIKQISESIKLLNQYGLEYSVIGKGSNLLVSDDGYRGVVIILKGELEKIDVVAQNRIECGSGASLIALSKVAKQNGLSGLEFAFGIPATVGGAVYMNAGAYDGEMKDVIIKCTAVDSKGSIVVLDNEGMDMRYRHSIFSENNYIIAQAELKLKQDTVESINAKMKDFMQRRKDKQPLEYKSAGSTFKRPEGNYAGALIEQSGLKGHTIGGAMVSDKHCGFIVNKGDATANDIVELIEYVKEVVEQKTGYKLECEIKKLGFSTVEC